MRELVSRVLDNREFFEVQPFFAPNIIVGLGRLGGHVVGIVGNQPKVLAAAPDITASAPAARVLPRRHPLRVPLTPLPPPPAHPPRPHHAHRVRTTHPPPTPQP